MVQRQLQNKTKSLPADYRGFGKRRTLTQRGPPGKTILVETILVLSKPNGTHLVAMFALLNVMSANVC